MSEQNENMKLWNAVCQPPVEFLKEIGGGRLKGMTDINPQWRLQALTEQFGPCGTGWRFEIDQLWTEPGDSGQVCAFARINLYIGDGAAVPGIGGSMLIATERSGLHTNDEAFKMAVTDALGVAAKQLGFAADVYAGRYDGSKYTTPSSQAEDKQRGEFDKKFPASTEKKVSEQDDQIARAMNAIGRDKCLQWLVGKGQIKDTSTEISLWPEEVKEQILARTEDFKKAVMEDA